MPPAERALVVRIVGEIRIAAAADRRRIAAVFERLEVADRGFVRMVHRTPPIRIGVARGTQKARAEYGERGNSVFHRSLSSLDSFVTTPSYTAELVCEP